jgi:hypothetical protein
MTDPTASRHDPWRAINAFFTRRLTVVQIIANLAGAGIVTSYFMFFDPNIKVQHISNDLTVIGIMFVGLVLIATFFLKHWQKDLMLFVTLKSNDQTVASSLQKKAQQKILNLPYISSLASLFNWFLAAIIMTLYYLPGSAQGPLPAWFPPSLRTFVGVVIAGIVTCAIVFFTIEIHCRRIWPYFFPAGGLMQTPGVFRPCQPVADHFNGRLIVQQSQNDAGARTPGGHRQPFVSHRLFAGCRTGHRHIFLPHICHQHHFAGQPVGKRHGQG